MAGQRLYFCILFFNVRSLLFKLPGFRTQSKRRQKQFRCWKFILQLILFIHFHPFYIPARHLPFRVGVNFDSNERDSVSTADMTTLNEANGAPGGIIGFKLTYFQISCQGSKKFVIIWMYEYSKNVPKQFSQRQLKNEI